MTGDESAQSVLDFWFGDHADDARCAEAQASLWWSKDPQSDATIGFRFNALVDAATEGGLDGWGENAESALARIILVDQFRRNCYRDSPQAYMADGQAQHWCLKGLARGQDQELRPIRRVFFYMPLEHAEDLALQDHCVALFEKLASDVPEDQRGVFEGFLDYANRHREIIRRFDRFPHRNECLGRDSTPEEMAFLKQPGSSF